MNILPSPLSDSRLADLLADPRETLDIEIKGWLDLAHGEEHRATLAKALLALANHGGGRVIIGLSETDAGYSAASERPSTLDAYSQDSINGIVHKYAEPTFHCSVHHVKHPTSGDIHPIIGVPGGHRVPIRAKRGGPNDKIVKVHAVYIRRPGPQSAEPMTGREWDELFNKCVAGRRDELLDQIRSLLLGVSPPNVPPSDESRLARWTADCDTAWNRKVSELPPDSPQHFPHGSYTFAYHVDGGTTLSLSDLLDVLRDAPKRTGWNTWRVPTHPAIAPYPIDDAIECWIGGDVQENRAHRDAAHSDFWRISPAGLAFLRRGYQEDGDHAARDGISPGTCLDSTLPIWRIGEGLLHAAYLAGRLDGATVSFTARYTGLLDRQLTGWARPSDYRGLVGGVSKSNDVAVSTIVNAGTLDANLVEIVQSLLSPLYERFNFSRLRPDMVQRELQRLRDRR